jgi:hypothetical protein
MPVSKKKIDAWLEKAEDLQSVMEPEVYRNYQRNKLLIDLEMIPKDYTDSIIYAYEQQPVAPRARILDYLIKKRCKMLVESVSEF